MCEVHQVATRKTLPEVLEPFCARIEAYDNPLTRIERATAALAAVQTFEHRLAETRREAMMQLRAQDWSLADIGGELGISCARVSQLTT